MGTLWSVVGGVGVLALLFGAVTLAGALLGETGSADLGLVGVVVGAGLIGLASDKN